MSLKQWMFEILRLAAAILAIVSISLFLLLLEVYYY